MLAAISYPVWGLGFKGFRTSSRDDRDRNGKWHQQINRVMALNSKT